MSDEVLYEVEGRVATITLNRPSQRNAVNPELAAALEQATERFEADDDAWVAVLIGGNDYREYRIPFDEADAASLREAGAAFWESLQADDEPPIDASWATYEAVRDLHPEINDEDVEIDPQLWVDYAQTKHVAEQTGFIDAAEDSATAGSPLAGYQTSGVDDARISGGLAGVIGVVVMLVVSTALFRLVRRREPNGADRDADRDTHHHVHQSEA